MEDKLLTIQQALKVPKYKNNTFAGFKYRNAEGILEKVKPLLEKHKLTLTLNDDIVAVGGRVYVKSTARLSDKTTAVEISAFAREQELKKGMDEAQITGSASSYARKYALSGLFLLDDGNDADSHDNSQEGSDKPVETRNYPATKPTKDYLKSLYKEKTGKDETGLKQYILDEYSWMPNELTQEQASTIIDDLKAS